MTVALRKAALGSTRLKHADLAPTLFCRNKISETVSCDAGCALVHKPQKHDLSFKTFVVGSRDTGGSTVAMMLDALKLGPRCDVAARLRASGRGARSGPRRRRGHDVESPLGVTRTDPVASTH